ncbi:F0F1 ATP synthase subunit epsilon [Rubellimicrobium sp. CFH 75288]|uniref:F0F1 ATP synthase subunit epsilon n=1 Tax=Rubellimicrobium sp. CFH 75288 TaxID=2697034 RepID=UPI001412983C|nr:F0F1 ATP synthase subunit epsilon [Rubellimicrobium sp. CFH 75288]NAZ36515.1 F0F1 ATP synthase subunit epsilon [Rubellimicrobium sp. CFH 75288]
MSGTFRFDLVSPERRLAGLEAREVLLPATDGEMTAMPGHAPVITTLRPGLVRVVHAGGTEEFVVTGGFAEITGAGVTVLAEQSLPRGEVTAEIHARWVEEARSALTAAEAIPDRAGPVDDAARLLADMVAVGDRIAVGQAPSRAPAPG